MGIKGLWPVLAPVAHATTLHELSINEGFVQNIGGTRGLRVGIDASAWMFRACSRHGPTKNPELATIFARCSRLLQLPILPIFAFDGPARPAVKRRMTIRGNDHWLMRDMKELLDAIGFPWIDAPGEAEAELAWLSKARLIDAVLTEDSDALVFGARTVLRLTTEENGKEAVWVYRCSEIASHPALQLQPSDLLVIALLAGGDYSEGLQGCGINTALSLAHAGLGNALVHGMRELRGDDPSDFLAEWRAHLVRELQENTSGFLSRRLPVLAGTVPSDFPDPAIIALYLSPTTSEHDYFPEGRIALIPNQDLDLRRLARFAEDHFVWGDLAGIYRHFASTIFPGLAMSQLMCSAFSTDLGFPPKPCPLIGKFITARQPSQLADGHLPEVRVGLVLDSQIIDFVRAGTRGRLSKTSTDGEVTQWIEQSVPRIRAWLPMAVVEHVLPDLLAGGQAPSADTGDARAWSMSPLPSGSRVHTEVMDLTQDKTPEPMSMALLLPAASRMQTEVIDLTRDETPELNEIAHDGHYRVVVTACPQLGHDILEFFSDSEQETSSGSAGEEEGFGNMD